jgi:hypothetical protein
MTAVNDLIVQLRQYRQSSSAEPLIAVIETFVAALLELTAGSGASSILVESGASAKISALPAAGALNGTEITVLVKGGVDVQSTSQDVANLAAGGGTPGGADTQIQYNDAGAFGGITSALSDGSNLFITDGLYFGPIATPEAFIDTSGDGIITLFNGGITDFNMLQFGGTNTTFPAIKRNGDGIEAKLADDSDFANVKANSFITNNSGEIGQSSATQTDGAGVNVGTLTNAPIAGNPTKWLTYIDNGVPRQIPAW